MTKVIELNLGDGSEGLICIEVDETLPLPEKNLETNEDLQGLVGIGEKTTETFEKAISVIKPVANAILRQIDQIDKPVNELQVKFGIKIGGKLGSVIAFGNGESNFEITLKWNNPEKIS